MRAAALAAAPRRDRAPAARRRRRRPGCGPPAHPAPRPGRHRPPLRPVQRLLRADPRRAHGLLVRVLDVGQSDRRPLCDAQRAKLELRDRRQARVCARCIGCSTSAADGARSRCTPPSTSARGSPASRCRSSSSSSCRSASPTAACTIRSTSACRTTATSTTARTTSCRRSRWASTSARRTTRASSPCLHRLAPRRRSPARAADVARLGIPRRRPVHRGVHRARHAHASGGRDRGVARTGWFRGARRRRPAASTTPRPRGRGTRTSTATTTRSSTSWATKSRGCGSSTSSVARSRSKRAAWASSRYSRSRVRAPVECGVSHFSWGAFVDGLAVTAVAVLLLMLVTWLIGQAIGRFNVIDVRGASGSSWSPGSSLRRRPPVRATTPAGCSSRCSCRCGACGSRATSRSAAGARVRTRATPTCSNAPRAIPASTRCGRSTSPRRSRCGSSRCRCRCRCSSAATPGVLLWVGTAVWAVGLFFEAVGDCAAQPVPRRPREQGPGDGPRPVALHPSPELLRRRHRVVGPVADRRAAVGRRAHDPVAGADDVDLTRKTGKPLLEQGMADRRPGYADYVARTSGFFPLPPKRTVGPSRSPG